MYLNIRVVLALLPEDEAEVLGGILQTNLIDGFASPLSRRWLGQPVARIIELIAQHFVEAVEGSGASGEQALIDNED